MKRFIAGLFIVTIALGAPIAYADNDNDVKLEELPKAAQDTVKREVKDGTITDIDRETEAGKTYYEVDFIKNNQRHELRVAPDGKVLKRKKDMD